MDPHSAPLAVRFIDEPIQPLFDTPPALLKKPGCPDGFVWRGREYRVLELLAERFSFDRRGAMVHNMTPPHAAMAAKRGSWGVGRYFFRVKCEERCHVADDRGQLARSETVRVEAGAGVPQTRVFEIYYDRAPKPGGRTKAGRDKRRAGSWVLWGEATPATTAPGAHD